MNNPKKNSIIRVEPIRSQKDITRIKNHISDNPRNHALFVFGINTNLRASDLSAIRKSQVAGLKIGDSFELREQKTGKVRKVIINQAMFKVIANILNDSDDSEYLFKSAKKGRLTTSYINRLVKGWCKKIGLKGNYGSHTLRKTWGYFMYRKYKVDIPKLMVAFNHSSQKQTLNYLCIEDYEMNDIFMNEI